MKNEEFKVDYHPEFVKELERLAVKKKFKKLPNQIKKFAKELEKGNFSGTVLDRKNSPKNCDIYKVRLPNEDTKAGKSNGYRVIYFAASSEKIVVLLTIYYKKEQTSIHESYIAALIDGYFEKYHPN